MLGERIRKARKAKGLTQIQLADIIGAKNSSISDWENNQHRPDIDMLALLSDALGVSSGWLLEEESFASDSRIRKFLTGEIDNLPEEARKDIDNYIEFIKAKYSK